jgi:glycosyltransferase involved in cell wall biosynthesis
LLSVIIICRDEENDIRDCLESVKWADEIIVVDSESKDKTVDIAKLYTGKIFTKKWEGYSEQRKYAMELASCEWILSLDADERVTEELKNEILSVINSVGNDIKGFRIPRKSYFLNRWIKHSGWYPGYQTRLFKKEFAYIRPKLVHEGFEIKGETDYLKNDLLHYTVTSITDFAGRVNSYSTLQATEKSGLKKVKMSDLLFRPFISFFKHYIFKSGFRDGPQGFMVAMFDLITNTLTYMKMWEMQNKKGKPE